MPLLPTLGPQPKSPLPSVFKVAVFIGLMSGGAYYVWKRRAASEPSAAVAAAPAPGQVPPALAPTAPQPTTPSGQVAAPVGTAAAPSAPLVAPAPSAPAAPALLPAPAVAPGGLRHVHAVINGPLEAAIVAAAGKDVGLALTQVVTRTLVWWIDMPGDIKKNDALDIVFEERPGQEPEVHAVAFASNKAGKTYRVYLYKPAGAIYARYFEPSGEELELRLKDGPLDEYERVTSLLRDGRRHKGVDFRTPVGTPVKAPFSGRLTRKNWNFRGNGNSLEITAADGSRKAMFLHLDVLPKTLKVGDSIKAGQLIANTGNSGHSFAPHLHYQLMRGEDRVLDPFDVHSTYRRSLDEASKPGLAAAIAKLDALMGASALAATGTTGTR